jgi:hypothetical protein
VARERAEMPPLLGMVAFATLLLAFVYVGQVRLRRVLRYSLTPDQIEIRLFGKSVMRIPFGQILEILRLPEASPLKDLVGFNALRSGRATALSMANRMVWESALLIRRRGSLFGRIVITPDDPDTYVQAFDAWRMRELTTTGSVRGSA